MRTEPGLVPSIQTATVRAGIAQDSQHGAVVPPLYLSTNFVFDGPGRPRRYDYTRSGNPTRDQLADAVAHLEGGAGGVVTSSGMAAVATVLQLLGRGDLLLAPHDLYGGCHRLFCAESRRVGFDARFVNMSATGALDAVRHLRPQVVWLETPSNPLLRITDIALWSGWAHEVGAICVVDNTFLSPASQRPLDFGADLVVHSTTKFINGHSDVVGGAVVSRDVARHEEVAWWANCLGLTGSPFDAYQTLRGLRTLDARMTVHEANALEVVGALADHPAVAHVHHPSLREHPGHAVAARQQTGFGSLVTLELRGGLAAAEAFVTDLHYFSLAESLGGVESLVAHPWTMTHASMEEQARREAGIHDGMLRLSVGIESAADLVADLGRALTRAERSAEEASCVGV